MSPFEPSLPASQDPLARRYPTYAAADEGLVNYWYPVAFGRDIKSKPTQVVIAGQRIALVRDAGGGEVRALHDRCPHRGVPLSTGKQIFPGTVSCVYHGWTYDLDDGELVAALTDGPQSPICGKANVRVATHPVAELAGLIWVFVGDMSPPPPLEEDVPEEFLADDVLIEGGMKVRQGNWRYGIENAVDEGHSKMLHRNSAWMRFRQVPGYVKSVRMEPLAENPKWLNRVRGQAVLQDEYPGLGKWPSDPKPWQSTRRGPSGLAVRLPGICRIPHGRFTDFQWFVPVDSERFLNVTLAVAHGSNIDRAALRLRYLAYIRSVYQHRLLDEDAWMIRLMEIPPERLYRPDASITGWRKFVEETARAQASKRAPETGSRHRPTGSPVDQEVEDQEGPSVRPSLGR